jgi:polar amino acid transport system substrate-binding protein
VRSLDTRHAVAVVLAALAISGCAISARSSSATSTGPSPVPTQTTAVLLPRGAPKVEALLPRGVRSTATLTVGTALGHVPYEFVGPSGTIEGLDVDLVNALAAVMGLKVHTEVQQSPGGVISGVRAGAYDVGVSSLPDTSSGERAVNLTDYLQVTASFFTRTHGGTRISGLAAMCGHTVSVVASTSEEGNALGQSKKCALSHQAPVFVPIFADQTQADQALARGRVQLSIADTYDAQQQVTQSHGAFVIAGPQYRTLLYGLATSKRSRLDRALVAALKVLIANGTYRAILAKWGLQSGALPPSRVRINGIG